MKKLMETKKGFTIGDLGTIAISLGVAVIVVGVVASVVSTLQAGQTVGTAAHNASGYGLTALNTLSSYLPLVALAAVGAVVIGIIVRFFLNRN